MMFKKKTINSFFKTKDIINGERQSSATILNLNSNVENVVE